MLRALSVVGVLVFALLVPLSAAPAAKPAPKMMLNADIVQRLRAAEDSDPDTALRLAELRRKADDILTKPLLSYQFQVIYHGKPASMLKVSRKLVKRATVLGLAWNLWQDERYASRGRAELLNVAALKDWNPAHFLDTAETAAGIALGLDWFTAYLSDADKARLAQALADKAVRPALVLYEEAERTGKRGWVNPRTRGYSAMSPTERADHGWPVETFNWNIVCNSGLTVAALALRPHDPALSEKLLDYSLKSVATGFAEYAPDGGFPEGADYWSYATRYAAIFLAAVQDVLGQDFGYADAPGFGASGEFILHMFGPSGLAFNYADSRPDANRMAVAWLAERYNWPVGAWFDRHASPGSRLALDLVWRVSNHGTDPVLAGIPTGKRFTNIHVASFRTAWLEAEALYAGFKGGDNHGHHAHLDLGTFVLDGRGERWAVDLGPGNYGLPDYFGKRRWRYYRTGTAGQNTLMFDGQNQNPTARAPLTAFRHGPDLSFAIADLGQAYDVPAASIRRGLAMLGGHSFLIQDEIGGDKPQAVLWGMHSRATPSIDDKQPGAMVLYQGDQTLGARIVEPEGARFDVLSAHQAPPQQPNLGVVKIAIKVDAVPPGTTRRIVVLLRPGAESAPRPVDVVPLAEWPARLKP